MNQRLTYTIAAILSMLCGVILATLVGETFTVGGGLGAVVGVFFGAMIFELRRDGLDGLDSTPARIAKGAGGLAVLAVCFSIWSISTMVSSGDSVSSPASGAGTVQGGEALLDGIASLIPIVLFVTIPIAIVLFGVYGAWTGRVRLTWIVATPLMALSVLGLPFGGAWLLPTAIPLLVAAVALSVVKRNERSSPPDSLSSAWNA